MVSNAPTDSTSASGARDGWLYGRGTDLLLGAGVGYLVSIPMLAVASDLWEVAGWSIAASALLSLFISGPHYGATILRVYERRDDRRKYALFAVWATLALCALFVVGLHDALVGSILITLYATWSPWHFSGQNYGIALMFLRRRGVDIDPRAKRLLHASFLLSFGLWIVAMHGARYAVTIPTLSGGDTTTYRFLPVGIPEGAVGVAIPLLALAYLVCLTGAVMRLHRGAGLRALAPALCLLTVQGLWYVLPALAMRATGAQLNGLAFAVIWISAAHAAQYLWVTSYYAKREDPSHRLAPYLGRALLAGSTVTILPGLIFAPGWLGTIPWDMGLAILLVSVVNLHHFVLDGAIWKLRDGRVARMLLRSPTSEPAASFATLPRHRVFRTAMALLGAASLVIAGTDLWQREFVINRVDDDVQRILRASQRLGWVGRQNPALHVHVARVLASRDELDAAAAEFQRSLDLHPTPAAWVGLGRVHASRGEWSEAGDSFAAALAESPENLPALVNAGRAWIELGRPDLAKRALDRARVQAPQSAEIRELYRRATAAEADPARGDGEPDPADAAESAHPSPGRASGPTS
jgi:tetratricopeptide (TPR) repeat protein